MRRAAVAIVVMAIAVAFVVWQRDHARRVEQQQREAALKTTLARLRASLEQFHRAHGHYPHSLAELGAVPVDPITHARDWRVVTEETVAPSEDFTTTIAPKPEVFVIEVHSAAPGTDRHGVAYGDY